MEQNSCGSSRRSLYFRRIDKCLCRFQMVCDAFGKTGTYQVATKISANEQSKMTAIPDEIPDIKIQAGYLPDGMEEVEEGKFSNLETPYQGGFSMSLMLLDKQDFESVLTDNHVVESEERNFGKYEGVYLRYQDLEQSGSYNQRIYLMCPDEYRMAVIYGR